jgi:hypothetical protein
MPARVFLPKQKAPEPLGGKGAFCELSYGGVEALPEQNASLGAGACW